MQFRANTFREGVNILTSQGKPISMPETIARYQRFRRLAHQFTEESLKGTQFNCVILTILMQLKQIVGGVNGLIHKKCRIGNGQDCITNTTPMQVPSVLMLLCLPKENYWLFVMECQPVQNWFLKSMQLPDNPRLIHWLGIPWR